jgi:hypothetical protein
MSLALMTVFMRCKNSGYGQSIGLARRFPGVIESGCEAAG